MKWVNFLSFIPWSLKMKCWLCWKFWINCSVVDTSEESFMRGVDSFNGLLWLFMMDIEFYRNTFSTHLVNIFRVSLSREQPKAKIIIKDARKSFFGSHGNPNDWVQLIFPLLGFLIFFQASLIFEQKTTWTFHSINLSSNDRK